MNNKAGFTLLELLAVMAMMIILMGIAGGAYYGMSRGAALRGAETNVRSALVFARQYAANRRRNTYAMFWQDKTNAYYQVYVEVGRHMGGGKEIDEKPALTVLGGALANPPSLEGAVLYDFSETDPASGYVDAIVWSNSSFGRTESGLVATNEDHPLSSPYTWKAGEPYGWAVRGKGMLPEGMRYSANDTWHDEVTFQPNGTTPETSDTTIELSERLGDATRTITVKGFTGLIEFD